MAYNTYAVRYRYFKFSQSRVNSKQQQKFKNFKYVNIVGILRNLIVYGGVEVVVRVCIVTRPQKLIFLSMKVKNNAPRAHPPRSN